MLKKTAKGNNAKKKGSNACSRKLLFLIQAFSNSYSTKFGYTVTVLLDYEAKTKGFDFIYRKIENMKRRE